MLTFNASARDGSVSGQNACNTCCCEPVMVRPGETNRWAVNFANWVNPLGGRGLVGTPKIVIEDITPVFAAPGDNAPPTNTDYVVTTAQDTPLTAAVSGNATDTDTLSYALLELYGPDNGSVEFNPDGSYTYTPVAGYSGYDSFWFTTSDQVNAPITNRVMIRVNPAAPAVALPVPVVPPIISVNKAQISVASPVVIFPIEVSPAAKTNSLYRLSMLVASVDCDGTVYKNSSFCADILIGKCG